MNNDAFLPTTYPEIARTFGTTLIATGLGLLAFVLITVTWGDPFTKLAQAQKQDALSRDFARSQPDPESLRDVSLDPRLTRSAAIRAKNSTPLGKSAGEILIPKIKLREIFVHGARDGTPDLTKGPGLYQDYPFPGTGAPFAIAGHRTTHGAPFLDLDRLRRGDKIIVTTSYGRFTYEVARTAIIGTKNWSILDYGAFLPTAAARQQFLKAGRCAPTCEHLVLTACHPKWSAEKRIAVMARLTGVRLSPQR